MLESKGAVAVPELPCPAGWSFHVRGPCAQISGHASTDKYDPSSQYICISGTVLARGIWTPMSPMTTDNTPRRAGTGGGTEAGSAALRGVRLRHQRST